VQLTELWYFHHEYAHSETTNHSEVQTAQNLPKISFSCHAQKDAHLLSHLSIPITIPQLNNTNLHQQTTLKSNSKPSLQMPAIPLPWRTWHTGPHSTNAGLTSPPLQQPHILRRDFSGATLPIFSAGTGAINPLDLFRDVSLTGPSSGDFDWITGVFIGFVVVLAVVMIIVLRSTCLRLR
jgi:hypothetical protein